MGERSIASIHVDCTFNFRVAFFRPFIPMVLNPQRLDNIRGKLDDE